jgi:chromosome segregation ATPase
MSQQYVQLDAEAVRQVFVKQAVELLPDGKKMVERVLPPGVEDPETVLIAVLKHIFAEFQTFRTNCQKAETKTRKLLNNEKTLESHIQDLEAEHQRLNKALRTEVRKVSNFQETIAFLGKRWEALSGEVNEYTGVEDPFMKIKQLETALRLEQEKTYGMELARRKAVREKRTLEESVVVYEEIATSWVTELADRRKLDEDAHNHKLKLNQDMDRVKSELGAEQKHLKKTKASEAELGSMLSKSQSNFKAKARLAEELTRTIRQQHSQAGELESQIANSKSVLVKSVDEKRQVQDQLNDALHDIKMLRAGLAETKKRLGTKEEQNVILERNLQRCEEELEEKTAAWKESQAALSKSGWELKASAAEVRTGQKEAAMMRTQIQAVGHSLMQEQERYMNRDIEATAFKADLDKKTEQVARYLGALKSMEAVNEGALADAAESKARSKAEEKFRHEVQEQAKSTKRELKQSSSDAQTRGQMVEQLYKDLTHEKNQLDDSRAYGKKLEVELAAVREKLKMSQDAVTYHVANYEEVVEKLSHATDELKKTGQEARELSRKKKDIEVNLSKVQKEQKSVGQAYSSVSTTLEETRDQLDDFREKNKRLEGDLSSTKSELRELKQDRVRLEAETKDLATKLQDERKAVKEGNSQIWKLNTDFLGARANAASSDAEVKGMVVAYEQSGRELVDTKTMYVDEKAKAEALAEQLAQTRSALREAKKIAEDNKHRFDEAEHGLQTAALERKEALSEVKDIQRQMSRSHSALKEVETEGKKIDALAKQRAIDAEAAEKRLKASEAKGAKLQHQLDEAVAKIASLEKSYDFRDYTASKIEKYTDLNAAKLKEAEASVKKLSAELRSTKAQLQVVTAEVAEEKENVEFLIVDMKSKKVEGEPVPLTGDWWACASCSCASPAGTRFCRLCGDKRPDARRKAMAEKIDRRKSVMETSSSTPTLPQVH